MIKCESFLDMSHFLHSHCLRQLFKTVHHYLRSVDHCFPRLAYLPLIKLLIGTRPSLLWHIWSNLITAWQPSSIVFLIELTVPDIGLNPLVNVSLPLHCVPDTYYLYQPSKVSCSLSVSLCLPSDRASSPRTTSYSRVVYISINIHRNNTKLCMSFHLYITYFLNLFWPRINCVVLLYS